MRDFSELHRSDVQALIDLGLTLLQARAYLTLIKSGPSKVTTISQLSKVARPDLYRTLSQLQQLGLVEEIIETPLHFRAIPMDETLPILLENKTKEYYKLKAETKLLLREFKGKTPNKALQTEAPRFVLIPPRKAIINRIVENIETAQRSVDLVLSWKRFSRGITSTFAESAERAWARGVEFRFIVESPEGGRLVERVSQFCRKSPACQLRFMDSFPKTVVTIYDKKEVLIIVHPESSLSDSPALWSNDQSLVTLAQEHFDSLWTSSM
jgi:sugar-specific transcriptional regulator TrmB